MGILVGGSCFYCYGFFPIIWTFIAVPESFTIIEQAFTNSNSEVVRGCKFSNVLWICLGNQVFYLELVSHYIGLSLTMGIVMGLAGTLGALIPLMQIENAINAPQFPFVIGGLCIFHYWGLLYCKSWD